MIADYDGDMKFVFDTELSGAVPLLVTRNIVLFPGIITPIIVGREKSLALVEYMRKNSDQTIAVFCQKDSSLDNPGFNDIYKWGVYARLVRVIEMPMSDNLTVIIQGLGRCRLQSLVNTTPFYEGMAESDAEKVPETKEKENVFDMAMEDLRHVTSDYIRENEEIPNETQIAISNIHNNILALNYICTNMPV